MHELESTFGNVPEQDLYTWGGREEREIIQLHTKQMEIKALVGKIRHINPCDNM